MKKNFWMIIVCCFMLLTGCGASSKEMAATTEAMAPAAAVEEMAGGQYLYDNAMPVEEAAPEEAVEESGEISAEGNSGMENPLAGRKLITTMNMSVETEDMDTLMYNIETMISGIGGYMEQTEIWNGSAYADYRSRSAYLTIRIPADQLDSFVNRMSEESNIVNQSKSVEDVTLAYVDLESHKSALLVEQKRLMELLGMAESMEDILAIEDKLGEVRYELESMESQLRTYDNKINYSTIYLDITEVERLTPVQEETTWDKISNGFADSLYNVGRIIKECFIGLIIRIPYLIVIGIIVAVVVFIVLRSEKRKDKKQKQKVEMLNGFQETKLEIEENADGK